MGFLGNTFKGFMGAVAREMDRRADIAHKSAQTGYYANHRLSETEQQRVREAESRYRNAAEHAKDIERR